MCVIKIIFEVTIILLLIYWGLSDLVKEILGKD